MNKISIVGAAGRKEDFAKLTQAKYKEMYGITHKYIADSFSKTPICLVSGGAAFADHLAVLIFLDNSSFTLKLYLPCEYDLEKERYVDTGIFDWAINPGGTANYYHRKFSNAIYANKFHSLKQIGSAIKAGAEVEIINGFMNRNSAVAQSEYLLAFTFGNRSVVKDGGTHDCVFKYLNNRAGKKNLGTHVDLNDMKVYNDIEV